MTLNWNKCEGDNWCPFLTVNLKHAHFQSLEGVYPSVALSRRRQAA